MVLDCENIVRFIRQNEIDKFNKCKSSAFKLRTNIDETYISIDRTCLPTFEKDALVFDNGKNSYCSVINVGIIRVARFNYKKHHVTFDVKTEPSLALSHGGIYILYDGRPIKAGFLDTIDALKPGQERSLLTLGVRSSLANLGSKHLIRINDVIQKVKADQCLKEIKY